MTHLFSTNHIAFLITMVVISCIVILFDIKYGSLKDESLAKNRPYSFGRVQLSWWTVIICSAFLVCIFVERKLPDLDPSILILLGMTGTTTIFSKMIDVKDQASSQSLPALESKGFFADILDNGNILRVQALLFHFGIGLWFIYQFLHNLNTPLTDTFTVNNVLPTIPNFDLGMLGVSSGAYLGGKSQE